MSNPKVVWSEGLFLTPQHLQKSESYLENYAKNLAFEYNYDCLYGFSELVLDTSMLSLGKFGIKKAKGVFHDGTTFELDREIVIDIPYGIPKTKVFLALPIEREGHVLIQSGENVKSKYSSYTVDVYDNTEDNSDAVKVEVAELNLTLKLGTDVLDSYLTLPVALLSECIPGTGVIIDKAFIPQCLNVHISDYVTENINFIYDKLQYRVQLVANRIASGADNKSYQSMIRDYLWLASLSEWTVTWREFTENKNSMLNPKQFYFYCLAMVGKMYGLKGLEPPKLSLWSFGQLYEKFAALFSIILECLRDVKTDNVTAISFDKSLFAARHLLRASITDRSLYHDSRFVLVVSSSSSVSSINSDFPKACKIAGNKEIANIVVNQLSGVPIRNLPVAPTELKSKFDSAYFEIDTSSSIWKNMIENDDVIALHIDDRFSDISIELYVIK